jgi:hypothetical protein
MNIEKIENIETSKWLIPNEDKQRTKIDSMFSMVIFITGYAISMFSIFSMFLTSNKDRFDFFGV